MCSKHKLKRRALILSPRRLRLPLRLRLNRPILLNLSPRRLARLHKHWEEAHNKDGKKLFPWSKHL